MPQDLMQAIADRASANPAYTQPLRVNRPTKPTLSKFHRTCRTLAVFVWGVTAGVLLYRSLEYFFPSDYGTAQSASQRAR